MKKDGEGEDEREWEEKDGYMKYGDGISGGRDGIGFYTHGLCGMC